MRAEPHAHHQTDDDDVGVRFARGLLDVGAGRLVRGARRVGAATYGAFGDSLRSAERGNRASGYARALRLVGGAGEERMLRDSLFELQPRRRASSRRGCCRRSTTPSANDPRSRSLMMRIHPFKSVLLCVAIFTGSIATSSLAHADAIPACPPDQHLVTGTPSSGHHGGGHCEPGAPPKPAGSATPAPSSSAASDAKKSGCSMSSLPGSNALDPFALAFGLGAALLLGARSRRAA